MRLIVFALAFYAGQVCAQTVPLDQWLLVQVPICGTRDAALEVAKTVSEKGYREAIIVFNSHGCIIGTAVLKLTGLVDLFSTPEGPIKVVEAMAITREMVYILTTATLEGAGDI